ncbi:MAG: rod shape-determining protein, partial [Rhodobacteraceae bacterium]|nr:rod shape-determining protein [Paracoccaceae bacterium]
MARSGMMDRFWHRRTRSRLQSAFQDGQCALIDIGSSKISCAILKKNTIPADPQPQGWPAIGRSWEIIGHVVTAVKGIRNGEIQDRKRVEADLRNALTKLFKSARLIPKYALVSYSGPVIQSVLRPAHCLLSAPVSTRDLARAIANCSHERIGYSEFTIHEHPVDPHIDGVPVTDDVVGSRGRRLVLHLHRATIPRYAVETLETILNRCGLLLAGLNLASLASGVATLVGDELSGRVVTVDIGGGTTNLAAFRRRTMVWTSTLPLGGEDMTQAISATFGIDRHQAERIKVLYGNTGNGLGTRPDHSDHLAFPTGRRTGERNVSISRKHLHTVLVGKQDEMLAGIKFSLNMLGWCHERTIPVVLTGGGSRLSGLAEGLQSQIKNPVRVGMPARITGMREALSEGP